MRTSPISSAALEELWAACPVGKGQYVRLAAE
jgi:hypothetical protein